MKFIDTHSHLYAKQFEEDREAVSQRAQDVLEYVFLPNIDESSIEAMHNLSKSAPTFYKMMMGLHPTSVKEDFRAVLDRMEKLLEKEQYFGIGETGIDLYWDKTFLKEQIQALEIQADWAKNMDLPLIIHCRDSFEETIEVIEREQNGKLRGVFHCFVGTEEEAKRVIDAGFLIGIGGVLTFKNSGLRDEIRDIALENIILETDAPYLTPTPHRGKRNESSYIPLIADHLAKTKNIPLETVSRITNENAKQLFAV